MIQLEKEAEENNLTMEAAEKINGTELIAVLRERNKQLQKVFENYIQTAKNKLGKNRRRNGNN